MTSVTTPCDAVAPVKFPGLIGPSNRQASRNLDDEFTENLYIESPQPGSPKADPAAFRRPALRPFCSLGTGPVRALFSEDGRAWGVGGPNLYQINPNQTVTFRGTMIYNANPATIASNGKAGHQLAITSGGEGYILDTVSNVFSNITSPTFVEHAVTILYFDTYFIALSGADGRFQLSGLNNGFTWNALDFGRVSDFSDQVIMMTRTRDTLLLSGTRNSQLWYNNGNENFPFAPVDGGLIEHGTGAPLSVASVANTLAWVGQDATGGAVAWKLNGATPVAISTPAVSLSLSGVSTLAQSLAWTCLIRGHLFYVLYVPGLDFTWVYDMDLGVWVTWSHLNPQTGQTVPFMGVNYCYAFNKHLVGDRRSGVVYEMTFDYAEDDLVTL